jgi:hypothetical protein
MQAVAVDHLSAHKELSMHPVVQVAVLQLKPMVQTELSTLAVELVVVQRVREQKALAVQESSFFPTQAPRQISHLSVAA